MKTYKKIVQSDIAPDKNELWLHDNILKKWTSNGWIPIAGGGDVESDEDHIKTYRTIIGRFADKQWDRKLKKMRYTIPDDWKIWYHGKYYTSPTQEFEIVLDEDFVVDEPNMFTGDFATGDPTSDDLWKPMYDYIIFPKGKVIGNVSNFFGYQFQCRLVDYYNLDFSKCTFWYWMDGILPRYVRADEFINNDWNFPNGDATYNESIRIGIRQPNFNDIDLSNMSGGSIWYIYNEGDGHKPTDKIYPSATDIVSPLSTYKGVIEAHKVIAPNATCFSFSRLLNAYVILDMSHYDLPPNITSLRNLFWLCSDDTIRNNVINIEKINEWDISHITDFYNCFCRFGVPNLEPWQHWDTSTIVDFDGFFREYKLPSINISNIDVSNSTSLKWMFFGARELTELDISNFDMTKVPVKDMTGFLGYNDNLKTIHFGANFDMSEAYDDGTWPQARWVNMHLVNRITGNLKWSKSHHFSFKEFGARSMDMDSVMVIINGLPETDNNVKITLFKEHYNQLSEEIISEITSKGWTIATC